MSIPGTRDFHHGLLGLAISAAMVLFSIGGRIVLLLQTPAAPEVSVFSHVAEPVPCYDLLIEKGPDRVDQEPNGPHLSNE